MSYFEIKSVKYPNMFWRVEDEAIPGNKNYVRKYIDNNEKPEMIRYSKAPFTVIQGMTAANGKWCTCEALVSAAAKDAKRTCRIYISRIGNKDPEFSSLIELDNGRLRLNAKVEHYIENGKKYDQKLADKSRNLLAEYKVSMGNIDPKLFGDIKSETGAVIDLYAEIINNDKIKIYIYAAGGSGKTYSLVNFSDYILGKNVGIVPIFIPVKYLIADNDSPILDYMCLKYANLFGENNTTINKGEFLIRLNSYLANTKQRIVIILDGINEEQEKGISDIGKLDGIDNCSIIVTSRNTTNAMTHLNWTGYKILSLQGLSYEKIRDYIASKNIDIPADFIYDQSVLTSPMFLRMFVESMTDTRVRTDACSQASIMDAWINRQFEVIGKNNFNPVLDWLLPVFALILYDMIGQRVSLSVVDKKAALDKTLIILNDSDIKDNIAAYGYDVWDCDISLRETYRYFNVVVCSKLAMLQQSVNEDFHWRHEHFRDFFVAKGLEVLKRFSEEKYYKEYIAKFMDVFKYPEVFEKNNYSAFTIALYFTELVKHNLVEEVAKNIYIYTMIRNIIYYSDDLGFTDKVIEYANYELMVDEFSSDFDQFDIANTLNGVACTLLKIQDISKKLDGKEIAERAEKLLKKADNMLERLYPNVYELDIREIPDIDNMSPEEVIKYFEFMSERLAMTLDIKSGENKKYLELYSRICGNRGLLYLTKYYLSVENNIDSSDGVNTFMKNAHDYHVVGALYKYCLYDYAFYYYSQYHENKDEVENARDRFDISLLALGTDEYHEKNYQKSISYYELSRKWVSKESTKPRTLSYLVRSKVADYRENSDKYTQKDLLNIIRMEEDALYLYSRYKMRLQIERVADVIKEFIDAYKKYGVNGLRDEEIDAEVIALAQDIDRKYVELYITTTSLPEVEKYYLES